MKKKCIEILTKCCYISNTKLIFEEVQCEICDNVIYVLKYYPYI